MMENGPYPEDQNFRNDRFGLRENGDQYFYCGVSDPSALEYDPKKNMTFSSARTERSKGPVIKVCKTLTWRTGPVWGRVALFGEPRTFLSEVLP